MRVAVLADRQLQRYALRQALTKLGHQVTADMDPAQLDAATLHQHAAGAWLVCLGTMNRHQQRLLEQLYILDIPMLIGESEIPQQESTEYRQWQHSLETKLLALDKARVGQRLEQSDALAVGGSPAPQVWLLLASLGGPAAVKEFLDHLPADLPIGFLYAQHIDQPLEKSLPRAVGRHSPWRVRLASHNDFVRSGEVVVVPVDQELALTAGGRMQCSGQPWRGRYTPSFEQMILNLAAAFGSRCGVIVFSGMGEDGSAACLEAAGMGMQVWAQCSQSSVCSSMPDSVRQTGCCSCNGSPRELALAMAAHVAGMNC